MNLQSRGKFSDSQMAMMEEYCLSNISYEDLMRENSNQVIPAGNWFAVECPFHNTRTTDAGRLKENSPNEKGVYFCNHPDCLIQTDYNGAIDMFMFWMIVEGLNSRRHAILHMYSERLHQQLPIPEGESFSEEKLRNNDIKMRKRALFLNVSYFYHKNLYSTEGKEGLEYLHSRGFNDFYIKKLLIGYASGGTTLIDYLVSKGFTLEEIKEAKLMSQKNNDLYFNRIIYPIFSQKDNPFKLNFDPSNAEVVNFYSRMIDSKLTEENTAFKHRYTNPRKPLYNYAESRLKHFGLAVEGIADTISAQMYLDYGKKMLENGDFSNDYIDPKRIGTFSTYGTNGFGEDQLKLLEKSNIKVLFLAADNDGSSTYAGQRANIKLAKTILERMPHLIIRIVMWPKKDVNDMLRKGVHPNVFFESINNAISLEEYQIRIAFQQIGDPAILRNQFEAIRKINDLFEEFDFDEDILRFKRIVNVICEYTGLTKEDVLLQYLLKRHKEDILTKANKEGIDLSTALTLEIIEVFQ